MSSHPHDPPPGALRDARLAGLAYLAIIALGVFGEIAVRGALITPGDALVTLTAIEQRPDLLRYGLLAEIALLSCDLVVAALLYRLLKPVGQTAALLALLFRVATVAMSCLRVALMAAPLVVISNAGQAFNEVQRAGFVSGALSMHGEVYGLALIFFGLCCLTKAWLVVRAAFLPSILGIGLAVAGGCYLFGSVATLVAPDFAQTLYPAILLPCLVAELAFALYLTIIGVRLPKAQASRA